ncbi:hypothetical protein SAMN02746098_03623 [Desulfosporosinus lacus DSM 15449]|uniref:Uncharacterized protein n=1 Tax=Desulfosporosinus lacus DSM 15449 TaxID=1121420 RepID=A0A1M5ZSG8_9FIRM|nr:hypothetical protein SAMN02746098_03623 [Desulfosporosinus lacus DSM 15449]
MKKRFCLMLAFIAVSLLALDQEIAKHGLVRQARSAAMGL